MQKRDFLFSSINNLKINHLKKVIVISDDGKSYYKELRWDNDDSRKIYDDLGSQLGVLLPEYKVLRKSMFLQEG